MVTGTMKKRLTSKTIEALKPTKKRTEHRDALLPGFGIRVTPKGAKTFFVNYRYDGKQKRLSLGRYPATSLGDARDKARLILQDIEGFEGSRSETGSRRLTVAEAVDLFIEIYAKRKNKTWRGTQRQLERDFISRFGQKPLDEITRADVIGSLDRVMARTGGVQVNRTLASIRKFFNWSVERGYLNQSPAAGISAPAKEHSRDRVLNDDELAAVWAACEKLGFPFGPLFRLLILTAQRRGEVALMRWGEHEVHQWIADLLERRR